MSTKAIKLAEQLLDKFFREAEGQTERKVDMFFICESDGISWDRAEPAVDYLKSRGLIEMFEDAAFLTEMGVAAIAEEQDIATLPVHHKSWPAAPAAEPSPAPAAVQTERPSHTPIPDLIVPPVDKIPRPSKPQLAWIDPEGKRRVEDLPWTLVIGRADEADFTLPDQRASKRHCEVRFEDNRYLVEDLGSANGTIVNGEYVTSAFLRHGDILLVGRTELIFESPEVVTTPTGPRPDEGGGDTIPPPARADHPAAQAKVVIPPMGPPSKPMIPTLSREEANQRASEPAPVQIVKGRPDDSAAAPAAALFDDQPTEASPTDLFGEIEAGPTQTETPAALPSEALLLLDEEDRLVEPELPESSSSDLLSDEMEATIMSPAPVPSSPPPALESAPPPAHRLEMPRLGREPPSLEGAESVTAEVDRAPRQGRRADLPSWGDQLGASDTNPPFVRDSEAETPLPELELSDAIEPAEQDAPSSVLAAATDLPEAPESPEEFTGDITDDLPKSGGPAEAFEQALAHLAAEARLAAIPDKDELLDAIELLRNHPYVRSTLRRGD